ncbi:MAG: hypothetical protein QG611_1396, partial [Bacteroidota bacterium]|nr:hypothetical protein [Bacteroidota bacterium]
IFLSIGKENVAIGTGSSIELSGLYNNIIGNFHGSIDPMFPAQGNYNVMVGTGNYYGLANYNVLIGTGMVASGDKNVCIGPYAGSARSPLESNKLYIANSAADKTGALIYGEFDYKTLRFNGAVGVNTDPLQMLDVNGNARFRTIGSDAYVGAVNRTSDGTLTTATSDIRSKDNISTLTNSLNTILNLRGISFTWKNEPEMGRRIGFIAQEVETILPELVFTNPADGLKGVNYAEMTAVLVEAIKEQQHQIESQQKEIEELKALVNSLIANQTIQVNL